MNRMLIIRADANAQIGTGHVMRCIALGQAWKDAVQGTGDRDHEPVIFICAEIPEALAVRLQSEGFGLIRISAEPGSPDDINQTLSAISDFTSPSSSNQPWLVLDGYQFDMETHRMIREAGFKLLCIDDYNHLPEYEADILLNQNISANGFDYTCNADCRKLLGTRFSLLRREFRRAPAHREALKAIRNILVTMGGSDPCNASLQVIDALSQLDRPDLNVKIIVGPSNPHIETLRHAVSSSTINYQLINPVRDMTELMGWADFAISAAGSTCWELAALGVPFATVVLADNQEELAKQLEKKASVFCAGWAGEGMIDRLGTYLSSVLADYSIVQRCIEGLAGLVDRFGVDRILRQPAADAGLDLYTGRLALRRATLDDAGLLLEWANDPTTRNNSFNPEPIEWQGHVRWLKNKLKTDNAMLLMLELDGTPCGHIRYDLQDDGIALLSFVVAPAFRGMGLGHRLVEMSRSEPSREWNGSAVKAIAFVGNTASSRVFEGAGFSKAPDEEIDGHLCSVYLWSVE